jgi:hypothetical protein
MGPYSFACSPRSDFRFITDNGALCDSNGAIGETEFQNIMRKQIRLYTQVTYTARALPSPLSFLLDAAPAPSCPHARPYFPLFHPLTPAAPIPVTLRSLACFRVLLAHHTSPLLRSVSWFIHLQTRLSDFSEYRTKDDMQLTELGTIKVLSGEGGRKKKETGGFRVTIRTSRNG